MPKILIDLRMTITIFGIFKMRKLYPNVQDAYKVPNFVPITFCILSTFIIIVLTIFKPQYTIPGLFITLLGIPVYNHWKK